MDIYGKSVKFKKQSVSASLYPSMLIEYEFYPKHLGKEFLIIYKQIKDERIEAKHNGNKVKNETLKLALNGLKM